MYFQLKVPENDRKYIFKEEQTRKRIPLIFLDVNVLTPKDTNNVFRLCQQTSVSKSQKNH